MTAAMEWLAEPAQVKALTPATARAWWIQASIDSERGSATIEAFEGTDRHKQLVVRKIFKSQDEGSAALSLDRPDRL